MRTPTINGRPSFMLETPTEYEINDTFVEPQLHCRDPSVNGNSQELSSDHDGESAIISHRINIEASDDDSGNNTMPHEWRDTASNGTLSLV